jgi:hypothetical protein
VDRPLHHRIHKNEYFFEYSGVLIHNQGMFDEEIIVTNNTNITEIYEKCFGIVNRFNSD